MSIFMIIYRPGIGLLITSVIFLVPGIWMCYYAWKKVWNDGNPGGSSQAGVVIQVGKNFVQVFCHNIYHESNFVCKIFERKIFINFNQ